MGPGLASMLFFSLPHAPAPAAWPGGTLWSHLRSQARPQQSGPQSGSSLERMKAQLNSRLGIPTQALLAPGHPRLQDSVLPESPRTCRSPAPAREAPPIRPPREAAGAPSARTGTSCPSDLPKAPGGCLHLQARRKLGQNSDTGSPWGLSWVREGAGRVLGGCGRSRGQSGPSVDKAGQGSGGGARAVREEQVRRWAAEMLVALEALHEQGVLCRDLNPRNLLLDQAGRCPGLGGGEESGESPQPQDGGECQELRGMVEVICFPLCFLSLFL